jgi:hypothetical protein
MSADIDMTVPKRKRSGPPLTAGQRRAMFAQMKFGKAQPWADYGAMRVKRGTDENIARFGRTWREADEEQRARRRTHGYAGRGSYFGTGLKALKAAGKAIGLRAGKDTPIGRVYAGAMDIDKLADTAIDLYTGRGMYAPKQSANSLIAGAFDTAPSMRSVADETGSLVITHRERVADVIAPATSGFTVKSYAINPGLESFAPWIHQLASCYEEYQILQCVYEYHGHELIGIQNSLDLQGQVIAATKYNVKLPEFTDRHEMTAYPHANQCSLNGTLVHGVEADPEKISGDGHKLVRVGGLLNEDDLRDYDHGRFSLAINNTPADLYNKEIGQLYVYYTIKLIKPKISAGRGQAISTYLQVCKNGQPLTPFGDKTSTTNTGALLASKNTMDMKYEIALGASPGTSDLHTWEFPPHAVGVFKVSAYVAGSGLDTGAGDFLTTQNAQTGNVTLLARNFPGAGGNAIVVSSTAENGTTMSMIEFFVSVRPNSGPNKVGLMTTLVGDFPFFSRIEITEINTLGSETAYPELYRMSDKTIQTLV